MSARRRHRHPGAHAGLGMLALAALLATGCDYFRPATPEQPTNGDVVTIDLSSPDATLETLRLAVEAKGLRGGDVAYRACFADSTPTSPPTTIGFNAFFWPEDANAWTSQGKVLPDRWTYRDEGPFYNVGPRSIASLRDEPYQMTWEVEKPDEFGTGSAALHRHYLVIAEGTSGVAEIIAKGYTDLLLVQQSSTGNWVITQWQDRSDPNVDPLLPQKTWGLRRLESR